MKILVTGSAGFIGFHLAKKLLNRGDSVAGIDNINDYYNVSLKYARLAETGISHSYGQWHKLKAVVTDLAKTMGYKPDTPVKEGIVRFKEWYKIYFKLNTEPKPYRYRV